MLINSPIYILLATSFIKPFTAFCNGFNLKIKPKKKSEQKKISYSKIT